jgi:uncharacterized protein (TIGR02452 family)
MLDLASRRKICEDTIARSAEIAVSTPGASLASKFIASQLPALDKTSHAFPNFPQKPFKVHNSDAFALARRLPSYCGKVGVLNLASPFEPGGGWRITLSKTQEEALCYSSTLYATLKSEWYPWADKGRKSCAGIVSPDVVVFKDTLDNDCVELSAEERQVVSVFTVAAPCMPELTNDGKNFARESDVLELQERIILVMRMAAGEGVANVVLGAMGCGAYGCPPKAVALEMKKVLEMEEFRGWFENVAFAVYAAGPTGKENFEIFSDVFQHN